MSETEKRSNSIGLKSRGSTASWKIRATQPDGSASEIFLVGGMTLGRTNANSIQVYDDGSGVVERSHARVDFQEDGSVVLRCLHDTAGVEAGGDTVSSLRLEVGSTFRIGQTQFEVVANPTSEQVSIASAGRGCPYCGHPDLPADRGIATRCADCGNSVVVVPAEQDRGVPTFLPGIFHDAEGKEFPIERFVARGGMGYVLKGLAEQNTAVAIKVLIFDSNTGTQAVSRFKQEIDLLRKLHNPNVLRLISHGQEAGLFFFVMEWVDGHDLRSELPSPGRPETHIDFAKALRWFEQACEGLSAIHRAGAVHRDIKPSNLLLRSDGQLLIADLGVAKRLNDGETGLTCTGHLTGTYWYMAPEQHYAPDLVDQRTDIYSLGVTFWELLTGFRPNGVDPQSPSKVNPTVPEHFDDVLKLMLKNRIQDRPATMREVLRLLHKNQPEATDTSNSSVKAEASGNTVTRITEGQIGKSGDAVTPHISLARNKDIRRCRECGTISGGVDESSCFTCSECGCEQCDLADNVGASKLAGPLADAERRGQQAIETVSTAAEPAQTKPFSWPEIFVLVCMLGLIDDVWLGITGCRRTIKVGETSGRNPHMVLPQEVSQKDTKSGFEYPGSEYRRWPRGAPSTLPEQSERRTSMRLGKGIFLKNGKDYSKLPAGYRDIPVDITNSIGMKMTLIPCGTFGMGEASGRHNPIHQVELTTPYYLGVYEVTNGEWMRVMGSVPSQWRDLDRPVEQVSWEDAVEFCKKLSALSAEQKVGRVYRLPTEAEWEHACRAGTATPFPFGDAVWQLCEYGWYDINSGNESHPVGKKKANPWGLYDMHGNVWEWCGDWYSDYPKGAVVDPRGPSLAADRVIRGGSWSDPAGNSRSAFRYGYDPSFRFNRVGVRLAMSPPEPKASAGG